MFPNDPLGSPEESVSNAGLHQTLFKTMTDLSVQG